MKEILYATDRGFLERYLKERAAATLDDFKAACDLWGNPIIEPGTDAAVDEIYRLDGDTAHIKIEGPLSPEGPDAWDRFWGYNGASYKTIRAAMERAKTDRAVARIVFEIDSPGGTVAGCDETWQAHKSLAAEKPTEVRAGNLLASAAYEIAAPAHKILAVCPSSRIGSIGVLVATYDWSKWEENIGIREIVITSSNAPDKHPDVSTKEGRDTIREQLNALERIFYAHISESRGVTTEHIAEHFGRGGLLVAQDPSAEHEDAIRAGMIDGLTTDTAQTAAEETENAPQINFEAFRDVMKSALVSSVKNGTPLTIAEVDALIAKYSPPLISDETSKAIENTVQAIKEGRYPLLGDTNTPAPAGTTQEGHMNLSEFLTANPAAAAEIDKLKSEAKAAGAKEAKAAYAAQVDRMIGVLTSEAYPNNIKALAGDVLAGKKGIDAFDSAVAVYDSMTEKENSDAAKEETQKIGAVTAEAPNLTPAAEKELDAALQAELDKRKVK